MTLDQIIPKEILDLLNDNFFELEIVFRSQDCDQRWPQVQIFVNNNKIIDTTIVENYNFYYSTQCHGPELQLQIQYYGKQDCDTKIDLNGDIIQDQAVFLDRILVNGVDIIKTNIIHSGIGEYEKKLSAKKLQYYKSNGINTKPTTSTSMHDNGIWTMKFSVPVVPFLIEKLSGKILITQKFEAENLIIDTYTTAVKIQENYNDYGDQNSSRQNSTKS